MEAAELAQLLENLRELSGENVALRSMLEREVSARLDAERRLEDVEQQARDEGLEVLRIEVPMSGERELASEIPIFARQAVAFCEQMRHFALHMIGVSVRGEDFLDESYKRRRKRSRSPRPRPRPKKTEVCRYFLSERGCTRAVCRFRHEEPDDTY